MKNKIMSIILVCVLLLTSGCGDNKYIKDKDNKIVTYEATGQMLEKDIVCLPEKDGELYNLYKEYKDQLNVDFEDDILKVIADKDAIKRVVINLLDNAIKFSYPNTTIGIRTWIEDGRARFCVGNFGDGISGADLSNIFNRFYKTDKSRVNEKSGAGLGLSFVKNIMTLHKQNVWVESVDTKEGSTVKYTKFTFTLELA